MRIKISFILLLLFTATNCKKKGIPVVSETSQWEQVCQLYDPTNSIEIYDMCLADPTSIWVVGSKNHVVRSKDGGKNWKKVTLDPGFDQFQPWSTVFFKTSQLGWIAGKQHIYKTTDGGETWNVLVTPKDGIIGPVCIYFTTEQKGFVSCGSGKLYRTLDGGKTWQDQSIPSLYTLWSIHFLDEQYGWVGGGGSLLKTNDSGNHWSILHSQKDTVGNPFFIQTNGRNIAPVSKTEIFTGTTNILKSIDGGATWEPLTAEINATYITMKNSQEGFAVIAQDNYLNGHASMAHTTNGGKTWNKFNLSANTNIAAQKIKRFENNLFVISGTKEIFKYNKSW